MIQKIPLISKKECKEIKNFILTNEEKIKSLGPDIYPGTSENSLTGRYSIYNYMYDLPGLIILPKLKKLFKKNKYSFPISIQSWANTFRNNEGIEKHKHQLSNEKQFICANLFICGNEDIGTNFIINNKDVKHKNSIGEIMLFPSDLEHYVEKNYDKNIRITMAFDIYLNTKIEDKKRFYILN